MIRVLIIDDSAVVRQVLASHLSKPGDIEVVGTASNPYEARDKIVELKPDVLTLDIEMPRMDGLTFLGRLMRYHPMPVIIVSSITPVGSQAAVRALELGAVDICVKPGSAYSVAEISRQLVERVRAAARARCVARTESPAPSVGPAPRATRPAPVGLSSIHLTRKLVAIGASTGGTEAIREVLMELPADCPGIVIVQHMPEHFTSAFAQRLNDSCPMEVAEASGGEVLRPGLALIAPGNLHMVVVRSGAQYQVQVKDGPPVFHQRPSVEVLFQSVARQVGVNAVGVILTGMGSDGASGLLAMRNAGATTLAQDEASCVVYGMPRAAVELGAAQNILPLGRIPAAVLEAVRRPAERQAV